MNTVEAFEFLDRLRESGAVNMHEASPVLAEYLDTSLRVARKLLTEWIRTYSSTETVQERAAKSLVQIS